MPCFEKLFRESLGRPIQYAGQTVVLTDMIPTADQERFRYRLESVCSDWRQGVFLEVEGAFVFGAHVVKNAVVFWQDVSPHEEVFEVTAKKNGLHIRNVWDTGDGVMQSWHNGAGMIVEEIENGRRYRCNDGYPDDDFDDLIFSITAVTDAE